MAVKVIRKAAPTSTGVDTVTGIGFTPTACKVIAPILVTADETKVDVHGLSIGFCDGTTQVSMGFGVNDGQSTTNSERIKSAASNNSIITLASSATLSGDYRVDALVGSAGPGSGQWAFDWIAVPDQQDIITYVFYDYSARVTSFIAATSANGTKSTTSAGFTPNYVDATCIGLAGGDDNDTTHAIFSFGTAIDVSGISQHSLSYANRDAQSAVTSGNHFMTDRIGGQYFNDAQSWELEVTSMQSGGVTYTTRVAGSGSDVVHVLEMDTGSDTPFLQTETLPTSGNWTVTGVGGTPIALQILGRNSTTVDTELESGDITSFVTQSDSTTTVCYGWTSEDGAATSNETGWAAQKSAYAFDSSDAEIFDVGTPTFDSDGWSVASGSIGNHPASAFKWLCSGIYTAAAGGLSIPIAAYHYNHNIGSNQ